MFEVICSSCWIATTARAKTLNYEKLPQKCSIKFSLSSKYLLRAHLLNTYKSGDT